MASDQRSAVPADDRRYCTQCGIVRTEDDADGNAIAACDEFGECRFCGSDTAAWEDLQEQLAAQGLRVCTEAEMAVLKACEAKSDATLRLVQGRMKDVARAELALREAKR